MATKKRKPGALYFTSIAQTGRNAVVLAASYYSLEDSDERRTALISLRDGVWGGMDLSGVGHAVRSGGAPGASNREYLMLERNRGLYRIKPPSAVKFERIYPKRRGFLMDLRQIDGQWYAVGAHRQIYRLDGATWKAIDKGTYIVGDDGEAKLLLSIDGTSSSNLYAVGFTGMILHFNGANWTEVDSPTNVGLQRVLCCGEDIYVCGNANTLMRRTPSGWKMLTDPDEGVVLWDMAFFRGKVFVCTKKKLFVIENDQLVEVDIPVDGPLGFYRMDAGERELWTCGNECLLQFDGERWTQHVFPDNA